MHKQTTESNWQPGRLVVMNFIAVLWLASWWFPELGIRYYWDQLDLAAFYFLNGMLADSPVSQVFWAVTNYRAFDLVPALFLGLVFFNWAISDGQKHLARRIGLFFFLFIYSVVILELSKLTLDWINRSSPSNDIKPVFRLSELVPGINAKDSSGQSFPGDHATVLILWSGYFFLFTNVKRGLLVLLAAMFFVLPRLVAGAHWLTDILIGSGAVALIGLAWLSATPLRLCAMRWFSRIGQKLEPSTVKSLLWMRLVTSKFSGH